ncbi:MAG: hypothetical protein Q9220_003317 [cf. Caloplaca sp. 1 TL-2023]
MASNTTQTKRRFFVAFQRYFAPSLRQGPVTTHPQVYNCDYLCHQRYWLHRRGYASASNPSTSKESIRPQNHYDLFPSSLPSGGPPLGSFHIEPTALRKEFIQLQAQAHPDRHQGENKTKAEVVSARINNAYRTLLNPLARARYLLSLSGVELGEDESIAGTAPAVEKGGSIQGNIDTTLLMEVMEVREEIEAAQSQEEIDEMKVGNEARKKACEENLERFFQRREIESARRETIRLGYWVNVGTALNEWEKPGDGRVSEHD